MAFATIEFASLIILAINMFQNNINVCRHPIIWFHIVLRRISGYYNENGYF